AIILVREAASWPRGEKFVVTNPPSARPTTELSPIGSGATAQPVHVSTGGRARASSSNTSIDSRSPWWTIHIVWTEFFPARMSRPCPRNLSFSAASIGPGQVLYVLVSGLTFDEADGNKTVVVRSRRLIARTAPLAAMPDAITHSPPGTRTRSSG